MHKELTQYIQNLFNNNNIININDKQALIELICIEFTYYYDDVTEEELIKIINEALELRYLINFKKIKYIKPNKMIIPEQYEHLYKQIKYLQNLVQPEQKSKEWFKIRESMITASDMGAILGIKGEQARLEIIKKKAGLVKSVYLDCAATHHGKKYEQIATLIYMHLTNTRIREYGLIQSNKHPFIGASPDGICDEIALDGTFCNLIGRMLEIKCPYSRKIELSGLVYGKIIAKYYWIQVQIQLEVCELEECDFLQCTITEYETKEDYLKDDTKTTIYMAEPDTTTTVFNEIKIKTNKEVVINNYNKGMIIQLLPIDRQNQTNNFDAKFLYPPRLDLSLEEYYKWIDESLETNIPIGYKFNKILYWKLDIAHVVTVKRDQEWFKDSLPKLQDFWNQVLYFRNNKPIIDTNESEFLTSDEE